MGSNGKTGSGSPGYEEKFADFIKLCKETPKEEVVLIAMPAALGDTYEEIVESLNRLADAELHLAIMPRAERG